MRLSDLNRSIREAEEFLRRAKPFHKEAAKGSGNWLIGGTRKSGGLMRQSLELTDALVKLRQPWRRDDA